MTTGGYIYAIGTSDTTLVKIGSARTSVEARRDVLQIGHPFPLQIVAKVFVETDVRRVERRIHRLLAEEKHRGEWFDTAMDAERLTALVMRAIEAIATEGERPKHPPSSSIMTTLGERILILRRRQGMTQRELAREAALNTNTIARLEQGNLKDLGGQSVAKLARALGTTTDYLLGMSEEAEARNERQPTAVALAGA